VLCLIIQLMRGENVIAESCILLVKFDDAIIVSSLLDLFPLTTFRVYLSVIRFRFKVSLTALKFIYRGYLYLGLRL